MKNIHKQSKKNSKIIKYDNYLLELSKNSVIDAGEDLSLSFKIITETVAKALQIERVSIWLYNSSKESIICYKLWNEGKFESGAELQSKDFPSYFKFLKEERALLAANAFTNPATKEFTEIYLKPLNIFSMLDAPIRVQGEMTGVICCEKTKHFRQWSRLEKVFVSNISDIVSRAVQAQERRRAQEKLKEINANLESLVLEKTKELERQRVKTLYSSRKAALGEMAANVAHEINNPLSIIACASEQLRIVAQSLNPSKSQVDSILNQIDSTIVRISKIVKGLKTLSRSDALEKIEKKNLTEIILNVLACCQYSLSKKNIKLKLNLPTEIWIWCQESEISQVILNLLNNSVEALDKTEDKWIEVSLIKKSDQIEFSVSDNGSGIKDEFKQKIMTPFFTTKETFGCGLGLSVCREILEKHNGEIKLDEQSSFTKFIVTFPISERVKAA